MLTTNHGKKQSVRLISCCNLLAWPTKKLCYISSMFQKIHWFSRKCLYIKILIPGLLSLKYGRLSGIILLGYFISVPTIPFGCFFSSLTLLWSCLQSVCIKRNVVNFHLFFFSEYHSVLTICKHCLYILSALFCAFDLT